MKDEQIKYTLESGLMKLGNWEKLSHYSIVGFLFLIPVMFIFIHLTDYFEGTPKPFQEGEIWFIVIPTILGLLFYRVQKNRLKYKTITTQLTREQLDPIIEKVANELEWTPYLTNKKVIITKTHPSFLSGSWGEQITILFDENRILINSICDPNKTSSLVSMGRNKKNMNRLIEEIRTHSR